MRKALRAAVIISLALGLTALFLLFFSPAGDQYEGPLQNGLPHGFGTLHYSGGAYYAGEFFEGIKQGRGTWIHPDGIRYSGLWLAGEYHGRGTLIQPSGARYDGDWQNGLKHGSGIFIYPDGTIYTGGWINDRYDGFGVLSIPDGFTYRGYWQEGRKNGEGIAIYPDGSIYEGRWEDGLRHGLGTMTYADGTVYQGGWLDDARHGDGVFIAATGSETSGYWADDDLHLVPVQSVSLDPNALNLVVGGPPATLIATIYPSDATNQNLDWTVGNPAVATVADGLVTPLRTGSTTVTVTSEDGLHSATCAITVSETAVLVSGISLDRSAITLRVGETATLIASISPPGASNRLVSWSSEDTRIAAVFSESGLQGGIRAFSTGESLVTVTTLDGNYRATCLVTVLPEYNPDNRTIVPRLLGRTLEQARSLVEEADLRLGEVSEEYSATVSAGRVIEQSPATGQDVSRGTPIRLVISKGPADPEAGHQPRGDGTEPD